MPCRDLVVISEFGVFPVTDTAAVKETNLCGSVLEYQITRDLELTLIDIWPVTDDVNGILHPDKVAQDWWPTPTKLR
jgi:hypothetical protein